MDTEKLTELPLNTQFKNTPVLNDIAVRFDDGKLQYHLVSAVFLEELTRCLQYGAGKYSEHNWRGGMRWARVFNSLMRHLWAWWKGEAKDSESGLSHLAHAAANIHFLVHYEATKTGTDDRYTNDNNNKEGSDIDSKRRWEEYNNRVKANLQLMEDLAGIPTSTYPKCSFKCT